MANVKPWMLCTWSWIFIQLCEWCDSKKQNLWPIAMCSNCVANITSCLSFRILFGVSIRPLCSVLAEINIPGISRSQSWLSRILLLKKTPGRCSPSYKSLKTGYYPGKLKHTRQKTKSILQTLTEKIISKIPVIM